MTIPPNDRPELTAYALGELQADQTAELHALLAEAPGCTTELEQIEAVTDALRHGAPIAHQRLTPEQRHAVLRPSHLPRLIQPMMPRKPVARRQPLCRPFFVRLAQMAAIIAVTGAAFLAGKHFGSSGANVFATVGPAETLPPVEAPAPPIAKEIPPTPSRSLEVVEQNVVSRPIDKQAELAAKAVIVAASKPNAEVRPLVPAAETKAAPVMAGAPIAPKPSAGVKEAAAYGSGFGFTTPSGSDAFISASKRPLDQFNLRPASLRPAPMKPAGLQLASPAPSNPPSAGDKENTTSKPRVPELYIHSWKAEVATCPWNEATRLLRVVVQLPADQPAAMARAAYPLEITFDPNAVREYRLLSERHVPASEIRSAGVQVVWYEFQPNGTPELNRDTGRIVATVTLADGRFTTQAIGPFDSTKLQVLDRGHAWQSAREDFVFESSIVGFGMLLRGTQNTGSLNHDMVLTLAEKGKGTDTSGERTRFIRVVQNARKAAGL